MWLIVLEDLLRVQPPLFPLDILNMSSQELKRACVRIVRLNHAWTRKGLIPRLIREHTVSSSCREIKLLPGGQHATVLSHDGNVALLPTGPRASSPAGESTSRPTMRAAAIHVPSNMDVYPTSMNTALVVSRSAYKRVPMDESTEKDDLWQLEPIRLGGDEMLW